MRYFISKKQYIRDKQHLSELQDKYYKMVTDKDYDLEVELKIVIVNILLLKNIRKLLKKSCITT